MTNKTSKLLKTLHAQTQKFAPIATDMFLPNHSGIKVHPEFISALSNYVPYTGATTDVDLGGKHLITTSYVTAQNFNSTATTGIQPWFTTSTTMNTNLNADLLDGSHASAFAGALGADDNYVTDAEKTNIGTLTNDSMADALHRHSELSASDGTPNPAVLVNSDGDVLINTSGTLTTEKVNIKGFTIIDAPSAGIRFLDTTGVVDGAKDLVVGFRSASGRFFLGDWNTAAKGATIDVNNGYVGIGAATPLTNLHVNGGAYASTAFYSNLFDASWIGTAQAVTLSSGATGTIYLKTGTTERMKITSAGVVNIAGLTASNAVVTDASKNLVSIVPVADGTYNTGQGPLGNMGTITTSKGIITAVTQAT